MDKVKCIFKSNNDCCNIYSCTCDYSNSCESNTDCPIKRLQAENERLKGLLDLKAKAIKCFEDEEVRIATERNSYRQALQEIKEIAEEGSKSVFADEDCDKILDKINEVIGDNNNG